MRALQHLFSIILVTLFVTTTGKGQIFISEVADPLDVANAKFIEIFNAGVSPVDFGTETYFVSRQTNGGTTWNDLQLSGILDAGDVLVIVNDTTTFLATFGFAADLKILGTAGNGDDAYFLFQGGDHTTGTLVDIYGELDVDGTGFPWEYTDAHAVRNFDVTNPNPVWTASEWTITSGGAVIMTPGIHQPLLQASKLVYSSLNAGNPILTGNAFKISVETRDANNVLSAPDSALTIGVELISGTGMLSGQTSFQIDSGFYSTDLSGILYNVAEDSVQIRIFHEYGVLSADTTPFFAVISAPELVKIVLTEIMYDPPEAGTDSLEYIELYNADSSPVNLSGYYFSAGIDYPFPDTTINPGAFYVVCERTSAMESFFGISVDPWVGSLSNTGEALILNDLYGRVVDSVVYSTSGSWPSEANGGGFSLILCDAGTDNADPANWSLATNFVDSLNGFAVYASPGYGCSVPEPVALEIVSVNGGNSPVMNQPFDVEVKLVDSLGNQTFSSVNTGIIAGLNSGSGILSGTMEGQILAGNSSFVLSGLLYDTAEQGVSLIITDTSGVLLPDTSSVFEVLSTPSVPYSLDITSVNSGSDVTAGIPFNMDVQLLDSTGLVVAAGADVNITVALNTGSGTLGGTTSAVINSGNNSVTITGLTYDIPDTDISLIVNDDLSLLNSDTSYYFNSLEVNNKLLISEVADAADDANARFIEIYNAGNSTIDFGQETYFVSRQTNGGTTWNEVQLTGSINAGEAYVIANNADNFFTAYGFYPDIAIGGTSGNGDDACFLFKNGNHTSGILHDIYGELDVDGTGMAWEYTDAHAFRHFDVVSPNTIWTASEWTIVSANVSDMTPGEHIPAVPPTKLAIVSINDGLAVYSNVAFSASVQLQDSLDNMAITDIPVYFSVDISSGSGLLSGTLSGTINAGSGSAVISGLLYDFPESGVVLSVNDTASVYESGLSYAFDVLSPPELPNLVITEIMYNSPASTPDSLEFVELYNNGIDTVSLKNFMFTTAFDFTFTDQVMAPGEFIIVAADTTAFSSFFGVDCFQWSGGLTNTGEAVIIVDSLGRIIDSVFYDNVGDWPDMADGMGASLSLCIPNADNSLPVSWSASTEFVDSLAGVAVYASPGSLCSVPLPVKLSITSLNNGNTIYAGVPFSLTVETHDELDMPLESITNVNISIELVSGVGILTGSVNATIFGGTSSVTISDLVYDIGDTNVEIRVSDVSGGLAADTSALFDVIDAGPMPVRFEIVSVNGGNNPEVDQLFDIVVEARDSLDAPATVISDYLVQIEKVTGSGALNGTLTSPMLEGTSSVTFSGISWNTIENGVSIRAFDPNGLIAADTSVLFNVVYNPTVFAGDIAFLQFRTSVENGFTFITLADIPGNTQIKFTDNGVNESGALQNTEQTMIWTTPSSGVDALTILTWQNGGSLSPALGTMTGQLNILELGTDQLIIYTGPDYAPSYVYALSTNSWVASGGITTQNSYLPTGLVNTNTAIHFELSNNGKYTPVTYPGSLEALRLSISDTANWEVRQGSGWEFESSSFWGNPFSVSETGRTHPKISIYPNPAKEHLTVSGLNSKDNLIITGVTGVEVIQKSADGIVDYLELNSIAKGFYILSVYREGALIYAERFIVE